MKVRMAVRLGVAFAVLLTAGWACAQGPGPGVGPGFGMHRGPMERELGPRGDRGHWWNNPTMVQKLKLTDTQRKAMDKILLDHREKLIDLRANLDKAELMMQPMMREDHPNEAQILAQIDKIAMARADLEKANARFLLAIRGELTLEQWKTLEADWQARRGHDRWGRRDGRRMGPKGPGPGPGPAAAPAPPSAPGPGMDQ